MVVLGLHTARLEHCVQLMSLLSSQICAETHQPIHTQGQLGHYSYMHMQQWAQNSLREEVCWVESEELM